MKFNVTKAISNQRLRLTAYLALTTLTFVLLAAGLSNLQLKPGEILFRPVEEVQIEEYDVESKVTPYTPTSPQSILGMLTAAGLLAAVYAAYRSREVRAGVITILVFGVLYLGVIQLYRTFYEPPEDQEVEETEAPPEQERLPEDLFNAPSDLINTVSAVATTGIILVTAIAGWLIWRYRERLFRRKPPLEIITDEVEAALAEIRAGTNLKDAVMRCYFDMGLALRKGLGLVRQEGMTPREFEQVLEKAGLPAPSVQQLTRLFEKVRYGGQLASDQDKEEAVVCLEAIVKVAEGRVRPPTA